MNKTFKIDLNSICGCGRLKIHSSCSLVSYTIGLMNQKLTVQTLFVGVAI